MATTQLPERFLEKLPRFIPEEKLPDVLEAFNHKLLPSFRINRLKAKDELIVGNLTNLGFEISPVGWYEDAYILENRSTKELMETQEFKQGKLYIQNLSSMIPSLILDPKPGETILDIAAAPGSKTTHLAALMQNKGKIIANDISRQRLYKLEYLIKEQGVTNTEVTNLAGQTIWQDYPDYFDKVLVDAPCSMEGRFYLPDKKTYDHWSAKKVKMLAPRQQYLLRSAISATKPGGLIVYVTCTLSPEENEGVINWILKKEEGNIELEPIKLDGIDFEPGIIEWNKKLDERIKLTARIYPSRTMEGFFLAKIRKRAHN